MTTKITSANITQSGTSGISSVAWQAVQTTGFTAVAGMAYPCDTTSAAFTVTLPASPAAGNVITLTDYAGTWGTNNLTIGRNGNKINGATNDVFLNVNRASVQLVYVDATQGWISYSGWAATSLSPSLISFTMEYVLVAGGGGGGSAINGGRGAGGGGAGGYLVNASFSAQTQTSYPLTIGGPGAAGVSSTLPTNGGQSVFASNTAVGGGAGGAWNGSFAAAASGGSGGGSAEGAGSNPGNGGAGTAGQGNRGGNNPGNSLGSAGAGGGGSAGQGTDLSSSQTDTGSAGGGGTSSSITGSPVTRAAGGQGGDRVSNRAATAGAANTGNGGGGASGNSANNGAAGGSGVCIIKIPDTRTANFTAGVTSSLSTAVSGFKIYTITAAGVSDTVTFS